MAIETEDGAPESISQKLYEFQRADEMSVRLKSGALPKILHGPLKLAPHGEEVVIVADGDGHEYCFVDARGFQNCVNVAKEAGGREIDWAYRRSVDEKARALVANAKALDLGPLIRAANSSNLDEVLASSAHTLLEFYAPWCTLCQKRKSLLQKIAQRFASIPGVVTVAALDNSDKLSLKGASLQLQAMSDWAKLEGYPVLFLIKGSDGDNPVPYEGGWKEEEIVKWVVTEGGITETFPAPSVDSEELKEKDEGDDDDDDDCDKCSL